MNDNDVTDETIYTLNALDRCDACQAQAYIRVTLVSFKELFFCAHHGHQYEETLRPTSLDWLDESGALRS